MVGVYLIMDARTTTKQWKIDYALQQYSEGKTTLWKAARSVGLSLREMIAIASKEKIPFQYTLTDLDEGTKAAKNDSRLQHKSFFHLILPFPPGTTR